MNKIVVTITKKPDLSGTSCTIWFRRNGSPAGYNQYNKAHRSYGENLLQMGPGVYRLTTERGENGKWFTTDLELIKQFNQEWNAVEETDTYEFTCVTLVGNKLNYCSSFALTDEVRSEPELYTKSLRTDIGNKLIEGELYNVVRIKQGSRWDWDESTIIPTPNDVIRRKSQWFRDLFNDGKLKSQKIICPYDKPSGPTIIVW